MNSKYFGLFLSAHQICFIIDSKTFGFFRISRISFKASFFSSIVFQSREFNLSAIFGFSSSICGVKTDFKRFNLLLFFIDISISSKLSFSCFWISVFFKLSILIFCVWIKKVWISCFDFFDNSSSVLLSCFRRIFLNDSSILSG